VIALHHVLLTLSAVALASAALRVASLAAPRGLERAVAAAPLAVAAAAAQALLLGLVGLGTSWILLPSAALATWLLTTRLCPRPKVSLSGEIRSWWAGLAPVSRIAIGAAIGLGTAWTIWMLRHPLVGLDAVLYHSPEIIIWVQDGTPGSIEDVIALFPVGNYPVTNEVILAWAAGISRSLVPLTLWSPLLVALTAAAGWLGLRRFAVPRPVVAAAIAAVLTVPPFVRGLNGPNTELPALAWLVCCAALCAASTRRPALLAPAIVAAGLAVGAKTTPVPLAVIALGLALWMSRSHLRTLRRPLLLALALALAVGTVWYLRNLLTKGSPFWPFFAAPWGEPSPPEWAGFTYSLLDRPRATLEGRVDDYLRSLGGATLLLAGGLLAPLLSRSRAVVLATGAAALALALWANAPLTGIADDPSVDFSLTTVRYMFPVIAAATLPIALAARGGWQTIAALLVLAAALAWNIERIWAEGFPYVPSPLVPLGGAALGALGGWASAMVISPERRRPPSAKPPRRGPRIAAAVAAAVAGGLLMVPAASGYLQRHGAIEQNYDGPLVRWFESQPEFDGREGSPIGMYPTLVGPLAGERLQHEIEMIPPDEPCPEAVARAQRGWVVLAYRPFGVPQPVQGVLACFADRRPVFDDGSFRVYRFGG
jgi:hypothetical protein